MMGLHFLQRQRGAFLSLALLCLLPPVAGALAQRAPDASEQTAVAATAAREPALAAGDIDRLIQVLQNDAARQHLIEALKTTQGAKPAAPAEQKPLAAPAITEKPLDALDRPASRFLATLGESVTALGAGLGQAARSMADLPRAYHWAVREGTDPERRAQWVETIGYLVIVLGIAFGLLTVTRKFSTHWANRFRPHPEQAPRRRIIASTITAAIELAPPAAFWIATMITVAVLQPGAVTALVAIAIANAQAAVEVALILPRIALSPEAPENRLVAINDLAARRIYRTARGVLLVTIYGYFLSAAIGATVAPAWMFSFVTSVLGIVIAFQIGALALRSRWELDRLSKRLPSTDYLAYYRSGTFWQVAIIVYLALSLFVWVTQGASGMAFLMRATLLSLVIVVVAVGAIVGLQRGLKFLAGRGKELRETPSGFRARVRTYVSVVGACGTIVVSVLAAAAIVEAWDIPVIERFSSLGGTRAFWSLVSMSVLAAIAVALWEGMNIGVEHLIRGEETTLEGMRRAARRRTLLPLVRRVSLGVLVTIIVMVALSELGINIAPLIAGAGVVGIAVGLGAQKIVRDLLGGIYVLAEDSIAIGDVVSVAGKGGVVEWMSLRAIRLRDFDGTVHTVPFGDITTVSNQTKHFAYAVFKVGVAYEADIGEVNETIAHVVDQMRKDKNFSRMILDNVELHGIDSFTDATVVALARLKVAPAKQWEITRQFQLLLKRELENRGIPQRAVPIAAVPWSPRKVEEKPEQPPEDQRARA